MNARLELLRGKLVERLAQLDALSPLAVLARGYAIATTDSGRAVRSPTEVSAGQPLSIRVHRGTFTAKVASTHATHETHEAVFGPPREEHS